MKSILFALFCGVASTVCAQGAPAPADAAPAARTNGDAPSSRDPRACLEFPTREQVIACAEKFRPHRTPKKS